MPNKNSYSDNSKNTFIRTNILVSHLVSSPCSFQVPSSRFVNLLIFKLFDVLVWLSGASDSHQKQVRLSIHCPVQKLTTSHFLQRQTKLQSMFCLICYLVFIFLLFALSVCVNILMWLLQLFIYCLISGV